MDLTREKRVIMFANRQKLRKNLDVVIHSMTSSEWLRLEW